MTDLWAHFITNNTELQHYAEIFLSKTVKRLLYNSKCKNVLNPMNYYSNLLFPNQRYRDLWGYLAVGIWDYFRYKKKAKHKQ